MFRWRAFVVGLAVVAAGGLGGSGAASSPPSGAHAIDVPAGRISDRVTWVENRTFGDYSLVEQRVVTLVGMEPFYDAEGIERRVLNVTTARGAGATLVEYVDLGHRLRVGERHDAPWGNGGLSLLRTGRALPAVPGILFQDRNLAPGADLSWLRERVAAAELNHDPTASAESAWGRYLVETLQAGRLGEVRIEVGGPQRLDGDVVLPVMIAGPRPASCTFDLPAACDAEPREFFEATLFFRHGFPYPLHTSIDAFYLDALGRRTSTFRASSTLTAFQPGLGAPLGFQEEVQPFRDRNPDLARSSGHHPEDGEGLRLPFSLTDALRVAESDPRLVAFHAWRLLHPAARLVGAHLGPTEAGAGLPRLAWRLVFAEPDGDGYAVWIERHAGAASLYVEDLGEHAVPALVEADLPHRPLTIAALLGLRQRFLPGETTVNAFAWGISPPDKSSLDATACEPDRLTEDAPTAAPDVDALWSAAVGFVDRESCLTWGRAPSGLMDVPTRVSGLVADLVTGAWRAVMVIHMDWTSGPTPPTVPVPPTPASAAPEVQLPTVGRGSRSSWILGAAAFALIAWRQGPLLAWWTARWAFTFRGYSKLSRDKVLDQHVRDSVLALLRSEPGLHTSEMRRRLGVGWGTLVYHLQVLERNRLVSSLKDGRHKRFFPTGEIARTEHARIAALANDRTTKLFEAIRLDPGLSMGDLAHRSGLRLNTITWHVKRLANAGLVTRVRDRRRIRLFPHDASSSA